MATGRALGWCVPPLLLLAIFPASAFADPLPDRLLPAPGEVVSTLPETVEGWFSEPLDARPGATVLQVFELKGRRVDLGRPGVDATDPTHVAVVIERTGRSGVYYAVWRVTSAAGGGTAQYCTVFLVGDAAVAEARKAGVGLDCRGVPVVGLFDPLVTPTTVVALTPSPTATAVATRTPTPATTPTPEATPTPRATPTAVAPPGDHDDGDGGFPAWALIATGGVAGALMLGVGLLLGMAATGGGRRPPRRPMGGPPGWGPGPPSGGGRGPDVEPPSPARPPRQPFGRPPPRPPFG